MERKTLQGGSPLYKPYRSVLPQRVGVLHPFGLNTGIDFAHFGLESGVVLEGTTGIYERIYRFNYKRIKKVPRFHAIESIRCIQSRREFSLT